MKTTTFDATELGLLEKHEFELQTNDIASKTKGDTYFEIVKFSSTLTQLRKEQGNSLKTSNFDTLREALRNL